MADATPLMAEAPPSAEAPPGTPKPELPSPILAPSHRTDLTTFGWSYDETLSEADNYSDFALAFSRNSHCDGGHMGVCIVKEGQLIVAAINSTLYDPTSNKSDVHAEANAICACARLGIPLAGTTLYVTMPPCKNCFGLLAAAGVSTVVHRRPNILEPMEVCAKRIGINMVGGRGNEVEDASLERVMKLWDLAGAGSERKKKAEAKRLVKLVTEEERELNEEMTKLLMADGNPATPDS